MSVAILVFFMMEIFLKIFVFRLEFFHHKFEILDAVVVVVSFVLDVVLLFREHEFEALGLLILLRLWRVARIINGWSPELPGGGFGLGVGTGLGVGMQVQWHSHGAGEPECVGTHSPVTDTLTDMKGCEFTSQRCLHGSACSRAVCSEPPASSAMFSQLLRHLR